MNSAIPQLGQDGVGQPGDAAAPADQLHQFYPLCQHHNLNGTSDDAFPAFTRMTLRSGPN